MKVGGSYVRPDAEPFSPVAGAYLIVVHTTGGKTAGVRTHIRTANLHRAPQLGFGFVALLPRLRVVDELTLPNPVW